MAVRGMAWLTCATELPGPSNLPALAKGSPSGRLVGPTQVGSLDHGSEEVLILGGVPEARLRPSRWGKCVINA